MKNNLKNQNVSKRLNFKSVLSANQTEIQQETHFDSNRISDNLTNNLERVSTDSLKTKQITESCDSKPLAKKPKLIDQILSRFQEHETSLATSYQNNDSEKSCEQNKDNSSGYNYDNQENNSEQNYKNEQSSTSSFSPNQSITYKNNEFKRARFDSSWNNNLNEDEQLINSIKCAVCNDSASGTRYGVCVCEGCKEFFR